MASVSAVQGSGGNSVAKQPNSTDKAEKQDAMQSGGKGALAEISKNEDSKKASTTPKTSGIKSEGAHSVMDNKKPGNGSQSNANAAAAQQNTAKESDRGANIDKVI